MSGQFRNGGVRPMVLLLSVACLAIISVGTAAPRSSGNAPDSPHVRDISGVYLITVPEEMETKMLLASRLFQYLRFADNGQSRVENVTVNADGDRVAPVVDVGPWSRDKWLVKPATEGQKEQLCFHGAAPGVTCSAFTRDSKTGDIVLYTGPSKSPATMVLRRASKLR